MFGSTHSEALAVGLALYWLRRLEILNERLG